MVNYKMIMLAGVPSYMEFSNLCEIMNRTFLNPIFVIRFTIE